MMEDSALDLTARVRRDGALWNGGMSAAQAVITELGGSTSHAAVVCREMGRPCVVGCGSGSVTALAGRTITVDGAAGQVYKAAL